MDTVDVTGLYLHPILHDGIIRRGAPALFTVRRGVEADSEIVWKIGDGEGP